MAHRHTRIHRRHRRNGGTPREGVRTRTDQHTSTTKGKAAMEAPPGGGADRSSCWSSSATWCRRNGGTPRRGCGPGAEDRPPKKTQTPQWRHPPEGVRTRSATGHVSGSCCRRNGGTPRRGCGPHRRHDRRRDRVLAAMEAPPGGGADAMALFAPASWPSVPQWRHPPEGVRTSLLSGIDRPGDTPQWRHPPEGVRTSVRRSTGRRTGACRNGGTPRRGCGLEGRRGRGPRVHLAAMEAPPGGGADYRPRGVSW